MARVRQYKKQAPISSPPEKKRTPIISLGFLDGWRWLGVLAVLTLLYYWIPLTSPSATPQWDAIDVHYSSQKYFADHVLAGDLPFWTPYLFSGFPFLADPQVGAWYPLNWPFFLAGITARAIQAELALHTLLALSGMYLLILRLELPPAAALAGSLFFGFSGFFADHTQHVGMFSAAAWLPWLALFLMRAIDGPMLRWTAAGGLAAGAMILAGHFQAALYALCGLALVAIAAAILQPKSLLRIAGFIAGTAILGTLVSAIGTLPGLELTASSVRAAANYGDTTDRILHLRALWNLVWPNATGYFTAADQAGSAAFNETGYYLYSGLLLLPLAALAWRNRRASIAGLMVAIPAIWYMLGPNWGLYRIGAIFTVLHRVRAPIHAWFLAVFGVAILAAAGTAWLAGRFGNRPLVLPLLLCAIFGDLFYWNSLTLPSAYSRYSFEERYGNLEENTRRQIALTQPQLTRFDAADKLTAFGPLNHPLDLHLETTYGYNPLVLARYDEFRNAAETNPKLLGAMNASRHLDWKTAVISNVDSLLPRAYFARSIETVNDNAASSSRLATLDPQAVTLVDATAGPVSADSEAQVLKNSFDEQHAQLSYRASHAALLRVSIPYFPGWQATVDGSVCPLVRVDHAFLGVVVPPGAKDLTLSFRSTYFWMGFWITVFSAALCVTGVIMWLPTRAKLSQESGVTPEQQRAR